MIRGKLAAQPRTAFGKRACLHLKADGHVPGNMYGHKEAPEAVTASAKDVLALAKAGVRVVDVTVGDKTTITVIKEVQWDLMGDRIEHFDLVRVDPQEKVTVDVHVELKGTAPGVMAGGVLEFLLRSLHCQCPVAAIPDAIVIKAADLEIGKAIHVRELELPPNVTVVNSPDLIVVQVIKPKEASVTAAGEGGPVQPEVIGKKADEKGDEKDSGKK
jgi:large subunit ribosomal protein L25